ncbi:SH3-like domain-containing protein [Xylophilus sp. GOD-11R]|uniref:SH3-like domain-containing protein n=1 Tax=Xylophilus sp. GOD-11R TaxID=3089814 RepID=UPI00298C0DA3|nr:SH3-like domain-containing protein [Xylophilus sp. GOD-11R]WPB58279.1 nitrile hydratase subunit beta [Xylophilus sp. GOD-11R]
MPDVHDLGGATGFGAIPHLEKDYEYHERWEWTLMAVLRLGAKKGWYRTDAYRHALERLPRDFYLSKSYYDRMLSGITNAYFEAGIVTPDEIRQHLEPHVQIPMSGPRGPGHAGAAEPQRVRFAAGDRVRVRADLPDGHVRAPAYVRGHAGTIVDRGRHALPFPGRVGHREEGAAEFTYRVEFDRRELWEDATDAGTVIVDLSDSYLEPAA